MAIYVDPAQNGWVVRRSPRDSGIGTIEPERREVQLRDKRIDGAYRIIFPDIVIETLRQKVNLGSIRSLEEAPHPAPSSIGT